MNENKNKMRNSWN